jgi:hypothetical protein
MLDGRKILSIGRHIERREGMEEEVGRKESLQKMKQREKGNAEHQVGKPSFYLNG